MNSHIFTSKKRDGLNQDAACTKECVKNENALSSLNHQPNLIVDEPVEDTNHIGTFSKVKISFDQEETRKIAWEKGFSTLAKPEIKEAHADIKQVNKPQPKSKSKPSVMESEQPSLQIPYNKKIEQIMNKKPLRQRISGLLPYEMQLPISFDHQQLLKRMELIDRTIQFLGTHRSMKVFFFEAIKKSIYQTSSVVIEINLIQQLLFLDSACYDVEWKMNEKNKKYDIKIALPRFDSMDLRKAEMRKKIVKYLILKQAELLTAKKLVKVDLHKWHELFDYKKISIPEKSLPVHPQNINSDLRTYTEEQIEKIKNPTLKMLLKKKKDVSQIKSLSSKSVVDMIFSKVPATQISNQILGMVKEKQRINNELKSQQNGDNKKVDKQAMLKIYDEILLIFMSKNVGNIFKVTLIDLLQERMQLKNELISMYVDQLLKMEGMEFLKVVQSSRKIEVVQVNKQKYREVRDLVASKF